MHAGIIVVAVIVRQVAARVVRCVLGGVAVTVDVARHAALIDHVIAVVIDAVALLRRLRVDRRILVVTILRRRKVIAVIVHDTGDIAPVAILIDSISAIRWSQELAPRGEGIEAGLRQRQALAAQLRKLADLR
jgi:hypothetical protein